MSDFRTVIDLKPSSFQISHKSKILFAGSCFTDNIGQKMKELSFRLKINPFGVVYNPLSLLNSLGILLDGDEFTGEDIEFRDELWFSWDHHSSFSNPEKEDCLNRINQEIKSSSKPIFY
jgi:hypothetical protein